ncbi:hypothetical protein K469DRAFT_592633 [Zopfia rhizophila CBS 207.26]|uniref:Uncharacterized protein n=1 Tax=Zopfia rhizophila CBS 207.26 TaxID=1314779 RepID=A0A6A6DML8_9PEZI|nr:hypothetical protein K469DRAFT_592633 [Zopfia rhizophila CBS 207.26]
MLQNPRCWLYQGKEECYDLATSAETPHFLIGTLPQILVSIIYISLNHHLTAMIQLRDWTRLASRRQPLRVTDPTPGSKQTSTYTLSLPYKYSIPLIISSTLLNWFISQSVFFFRFRWFDNDGRIFKYTINHFEDWWENYDYNIYEFGLGYSAMALSAPWLLALSYSSCKPGLPLGASNSFVIAAACHPPERNRAAALKMVQWGVTHARTDLGRGVQHCSITSYEVEPPEEGQLYA